MASRRDLKRNINNVLGEHPHSRAYFENIRIILKCERIANPLGNSFVMKEVLAKVFFSFYLFGPFHELYYLDCLLLAYYLKLRTEGDKLKPMTGRTNLSVDLKATLQLVGVIRSKRTFKRKVVVDDRGIASGVRCARCQAPE